MSRRSKPFIRVISESSRSAHGVFHAWTARRPSERAPNPLTHTGERRRRNAKGPFGFAAVHSRRLPGMWKRPENPLRSCYCWTDVSPGLDGRETYSFDSVLSRLCLVTSSWAAGTSCASRLLGELPITRVSHPSW